MRDVLQEKYYNFSNVTEDDKYLVQTRSQAKPSGVKVPQVHGIEKSLVLHVKPERQKSIKPPRTRDLLSQSLELAKVEQELEEK